MYFKHLYSIAHINIIFHIVISIEPAKMHLMLMWCLSLQASLQGQLLMHHNTSSYMNNQYQHCEWPMMLGNGEQLNQTKLMLPPLIDLKIKILIWKISVTKIASLRRKKKTSRFWTANNPPSPLKFYWVKSKIGFISFPSDFATLLKKCRIGYQILY